MFGHIRRYFISGLLIWLPIWVTLLVVGFLMHTTDRILTLIPVAYQPDHLLGFHVPGIGLIVTVVVLLITGLITANVLGRYFFNLGDMIITRIPVIRSIYSAVKTTVETLVNSQNQAFRKVVLVEYPYPGSWSIAFQTSNPCRMIADKLEGDMLTLFIPTTPIPTSGFLIIVHKSQVREINMTVDEALRMVVSLGVVQPNGASKLIQEK